MPIQPGQMLRNYRLVDRIGEGGMGVVWRAVDTTLDRDVAIKILPEEVVGNPVRLARFEREAKAIAALAQPNILSVFDFGREDSIVFMVTELLEGKSLRDWLADGPLPPRKAADIARQVARGLAAAHAKHFVHRDLKPENIFVSHDGQAKVLDFGLAASLQPGAGGGNATHTPTETELTSPGSVMGTVDYMSPEQARGEEVDFRSDIFSLGSVLYEMLTGVRPFHRETAPETMTAVIREDPAPASGETATQMPAALERVVRRCLEKQPQERFQSASDLAFAVDNAARTTSVVSSEQPAIAVETAARRRRPWIVPLVGAAMLIVGVLAGRWSMESPGVETTYSQLTYREGTISSARFGSEGNVVYAAGWDGRVSELYTVHQGSPESRSLGVEDVEILSISSKGELALLLQPRFRTGWSPAGTLARMPLGGGAPREMLEDIASADWDPAGENLAVVRIVGRLSRLEYPPGTPLYETAGWIGDVRFSPDGKRIAFANHPTLGDDRGHVSVVGLDGRERRLGQTWSSLRGVAWSPDSREVRFTAGRTGTIRGIHGIDLAGNLRVLSSAPVDMLLHDIDANGRFLITRNNVARRIVGRAPGAASEVPLSWLDWSFPMKVSDDGSVVLFTEQGEGGGAEYGSYIRPTDGGPAVRLGSGQARDLHPDGTRILASSLENRGEFVIYPTGAGETIRVTLPNFERLRFTRFTGRGNEVVAYGSHDGAPPQGYLFDPSVGELTPIGPEGTPLLVNPSQGLVAIRTLDDRVAAYPLDGGSPQPLPRIEPDQMISGWSEDGRVLYLLERGTVPLSILRYDRERDTVEPFLELMPPSPAGLIDIGPASVNPAGTAYLYSYRRYLSTLYLGEGF